MEQRFFDRKPSGKVELDLCFACHSIWFDQYESVALTPGAVLELFRLIHEHHDQPPRPLGDVLRCPACRAGLALTHDLQRSTRISYYRCPKVHGRLTTFFQFLREKQFVRELTGGEIERLRATVKQVRCSSCGAPVDLARNAACAYCRAPVSILDAEAVRKTLDELDAQERGRRLGDPQEVVNALLEGRRANIGGRVDPDAALAAVLASGKKGKARPRGDARGGGILDLVSDALEFLGNRTEETMRTVLVTMAAALALGACGSLQKKEPPPKPFTGTKWVVQLEVPLQGTQPWVQFGDGLMDGFGGCNRIAAKYVQDTVGSRFIAFSRIDRGTKACDSRNQLIEQRTLEVLQAVSSYRIIADTMTMQGSAGALRFLSDPPYTPEELKK